MDNHCKTICRPIRNECSSCRVCMYYVWQSDRRKIEISTYLSHLKFKSFGCIYWLSKAKCKMKIVSAYTGTRNNRLQYTWLNILEPSTKLVLSGRLVNKIMYEVHFHSRKYSAKIDVLSTPTPLIEGFLISRAMSLNGTIGHHKSY